MGSCRNNWCRQNNKCPWHIVVLPKQSQPRRPTSRTTGTPALRPSHFQRAKFTAAVRNIAGYIDRQTRASREFE